MQFDFASTSPSPLRAAIDAKVRPPELDCVPELLEAAELPQAAQAKAQANAMQLVKQVREKRTRASGVDALMREFSLSSDEGIALMCLAEALLRIPDAATRDALIRDKIGGADWQAHLGQSPSLFVNAASWGLLLTGKLVATHNAASLTSAVTRLLGKGGEPVIRKAVDLAMRMLGRQFVTGETIEAAISQGAPNIARGYRYSYDMLGEAALTQHDADRYLAAYRHAIDQIGASNSPGAGVRRGPGISIKLSALHPRYQRQQRERVMAELLPTLCSLVRQARAFDIGLNIDAEESERLDLSLDLLEALASDPATKDWEGLGFVVQAYSKRAPAVLSWLIGLARSAQRRLMVRLVKGAYWDSEVKRAQIEGQLDYPVYTRKVHTDVAYQACAHQLLSATDVIYPQFATHNAYTMAWVLEAARCAGVPQTDFEFQCLHGMGETLYDQVIDPREALACRVYAPVGSHETLLAYLVRRLLENGANSSFVNRIVDPRVAVSELAADPVQAVRSQGSAMHPRIVLPAQLFAPARRNSQGFETATESALRQLEGQLNCYATYRWHATASGTNESSDDRTVTQRNPGDHGDITGTVRTASHAEIRRAIDQALAAGPSWAAQDGNARALILERAAQAFEDERIEFAALLMREAGKTVANAIGEIREAVDFCRYYAAQIRATVATSALPPLVCISPWNFPLAIFTGQTVAALAAGRCVLAKPAEQTPLVAARAVQLFYRAGVPTDVLHLLPGDGPAVGVPLVADAHIGGVLFTGSTAVARQISQVLARRADDPILVAETGGINCMLVDSSALTEQVVQDVLSSAFDSAGQRCSALRLLCVQADAAKSTLRMLKGAFAELRVGPSMRYANDIGPVIDQEAQQRLETYIAGMRARGFAVTRLALDPALPEGFYVAPTIIEIDHVDDLEEEVFGPILHVLTYPLQTFEDLIAAINQKGYGLTMGIHSRIEEHIERVERRAQVGNLYVNRNMIGAVVGVQPFGGEGLSGTGPKAGGPLYLPRLGQPLAALRDVPAAGAQTRIQIWAEALAQGRLTPSEQRRLNAFAQHLATINWADCSIELSGPTGESNRLRFRARQTIACVAQSSFEMLRLATLVTALGGRPLADPALIEPAMCHLIAALHDEQVVDALVIGVHSPHIGSWRERLAHRAGPIVPLVLVPDEDAAVDARLLARLLHERSISINTAAAGGNAALMVLEEA